MKSSIRKLALLLLCCFMISGCGKKESDSEELAEQFLTTIFSSDLNDRYSNFSNTDISNEEEMNAAYELYYKDIKDMVSVECLSDLMANRVPLSYDKAADGQKAEVSVKKVTLSQPAEGKYRFTADLEIRQQEAVAETNCTGEIQTTVKEGKEQITSFFCDKSSEYFQIFSPEME